MISRRRITYALIGLVALVVLGTLWRDHWGPTPTEQATSSPLSHSRTTAPTAPGLVARGLSQLPPEARHTWKLIESNGPFPHSRDGAVFENRERLLPRQRGGYYHEYTVPTPGEDDRGARRLVTGERDDELYYTDDHYRSFVVVDPRG